ncbi:uncharacterized protein LOC113752510 [Coffea eugenioides]|uniref:uncharacterized protein LOC113752510 n=1 Tax=Coffea eugenioides TaxID=49369 RepID=UPI000F614325|nr:uncharacterized protein LOC113752510 [Coffea eugenioides]
MALIISTQIQLKPSNPLQNQILHPQVGFVTVRTKKTNCFSSDNVNHYRFKLRIGYKDSIFRTRVSDDSGAIPFQPSSSADVDARGRSSSGSSDGYVALFVRMLGLDNDPLDREQAVVALWKYSLGGKKCIDNVMQFHGAVNLTVNLLKSDSDSACEAAAGILRTISSINVYRNTVAESGAVEEITSMLRRTSLSSNMSSGLKTSSIQCLRIIESPPAESNMKHGFLYEAVRLQLTVTARPQTKSTFFYSVQTMYVRDVVNSAFLARIIEILKTSSPNLQKKAASILEFVIVDDACVEMVISVDVASGLVCVFQQRLSDIEADTDVQRPELLALQVEEAGQAISAASRLFTRLLDSEHFRSTIDTQHFMHLLRKILISEIPICYKDWVASCLVKLSSFSGPNLDFENPVNMEVTLYETIPRLIEQIKTSSSPELQEAAVIELNRIISEGVVDSTRAVAAQGGIFPLVKLIEEGSNRAMEAGLSILYNLSMDSENHAAIMSAGAVPILRRIVLSQKPQWTRALHLLRTLPTWE